VSPQSIEHGDKVTEPTTPPTRDGYTFGGWYKESACTNAWNFASDVVTSTVTLYAKWTLITYTVAFNANGGSVTPESGTPRTDGTLASLPTPTRSGYDFDGWYTASTGGTSVTTSTVFASNTTIYAQWTVYVYTGKVVTIGTQKWMGENLNRATANSKCYNNSADSCSKYGRLYNWNDALTACPVDWHLPDTTEWNILVSYVETEKNCSNCAGKYLKSQSGWYNNGNGEDAFEFSALPGGNGSSDGSFNGAGNYGYWWSSTEIDA